MVTPKNGTNTRMDADIGALEQLAPFILVAVAALTAGCSTTTAPDRPIVLKGEGVISETKPPIEQTPKVVGKADYFQCRYERIADWHPHPVDGRTIWTPVIEDTVNACR